MKELVIKAARNPGYVW